MDAHTALLTRASIGALAEPVPDAAVMERAFRAALRAPDHRMLRPWRFLVIDGAARERLGQLFLTAGLADNPAMPEVEQQRLLAMPMRAPLLVVAIMSPKADPKVPPVEQVLSAGASVQNFLLSLHADGYCGMWRTGWMAEHPRVKAGLGLAPSEDIAGFIYIGTPTAGPKPSSSLRVNDFVRAWSPDA